MLFHREDILRAVRKRLPGIQMALFMEVTARNIDTLDAKIEENHYTDSTGGTLQERYVSMKILLRSDWLGE